MVVADTPQAGGERVTLVIFGASGDLARRKLVPSLASLHSKGRLDRNLQVLGVARSDMDDGQFRAALEEFLGSEGNTKPTPDQWADFSSRIHYMHGDVTSLDDMAAVKEKLAEIEGETASRNRLYYLSLAPVLYRPAIAGLGETGMAEDLDGWRRLVVEKPFGTDLASARELNEVAHFRLSGRPGFPHRPLPGKGDGAEPAGFPVRQRHFRANLEPQLHRPTCRLRWPKPCKLMNGASITTRRAFCGICFRTTCCSC